MIALQAALRELQAAALAGAQSSDAMARALELMAGQAGEAARVLPEVASRLEAMERSNARLADIIEASAGRRLLGWVEAVGRWLGRWLSGRVGTMVLTAAILLSLLALLDSSDPAGDLGRVVRALTPWSTDVTEITDGP